MPLSPSPEDSGIVLGDLTLVTVFLGEPAELRGDIGFAKAILNQAVPEDDPGGVRFKFIAGYESPSGLGLRLEETRGLDRGVRLIARKAAGSVDDLQELSALMRTAVGRVKSKPNVTGTNFGRLFITGDYLDVDYFLKRGIEGSALAKVVGGRNRDPQNLTVSLQLTAGGVVGPGQVRIERVRGRVAPIGTIEGASVEINFNTTTLSKSSVYEAIALPVLHARFSEAEKIFRRFASESQRGRKE